MPFTSYNYFSADEPETAVMLEALINYWEPVGIDVTLLDSEWGSVRKELQGQADRLHQERRMGKRHNHAGSLTTHLRSLQLCGWRKRWGAYHSEVH